MWSACVVDQIRDRSPGGAVTHSGIGGHILVAAGACVLTVTIVGSAAFLAYRVYDRYQLRAQVRDVVDSLQNRSPAELAEKAALIKKHPKAATVVLPEILRSLRQSKSEQQQCSAIQVLRAFANHKRVQKTLFRLRKDPRESVAAAAVQALGYGEPPERTIAMMGRCLEDAKAGAVVDAVIDEACACLYRQGEMGRREMEQKLPMLSVGRRIWLVGYVDATRGPSHKAWLDMLRKDSSEDVRAAAKQALLKTIG